MPNTKITGLGFYVPENVVTNKEMEGWMDTSDEWIQERTGIKERRYVTRHKGGTSSMGARAARIAIERAGIDKEDIDFIVFATLSPDYYFPGSGVLVQRELGITKTEIGALDVRTQCTGFVYGLSVADQFIKSGMYKTILLIGSETHSMGLDYATSGRDVTVIFGDGAGAAILQATEEEGGILTSKLHSDGTYAEELAMINPGSHGGYHGDVEKYGYNDKPKYGDTFVSQKMLDDGMLYPNMHGQLVFKHAVVKFPAVIKESLDDAGYTVDDLSMLIPHQANLRISQFVQRRLGLRDDQVWNNIQNYGNTTAASIPIALTEAWEAGKVQSGDLVCLAAFGSGFTWASALIRWI
jgi:3-oxoacyl-[acyl-carrier-protein] synthase III